MKKLLKAVIILPIFIIGMFLVKMGQQDKTTYQIEKWDNVYNENSIQFYYEKLSEPRLKIINSTYKIDEFLSEEQSEIDKVKKAAEILNNIVKYNSAAKDTEAFNGYDILSLKGDDNKASQRDMAIILRDILYSAGIYARVGEFRSEKEFFIKEQNYHVIEYWSVENEKWIMYDFIEMGYFTDKNIPCSGVELAVKGLNNLEFIGIDSSSRYTKSKGRIFTTYSIMIDNTMDMQTSNTYIEYFNKKNKINLEYKNNFLPPIIYTKSTELFEAAPKAKAILSDKRAYIIIMKADGENDKFIVGAFQNSRVIRNYFISINNSDYYRVNTYESIEFTPGNNSISVSLDGEEETARIEVKYTPDKTEKIEKE